MRADYSRDGILAVISDFVTGFTRGNRELLLQALHPRFVSTGFFKGELQWDSAEAFAAFCEEAAPDPESPVPEWQIVFKTFHSFG